MIKVCPAPGLRRDFARWGRQYRLRTVSQSTFGVPDHLVPAIPAELLVGAHLDGQPYVAPVPAPAQDLDPILPAELAPAIPAVTVPEEITIEAGPYPCGTCERVFDTPRGRDTHGRQAHSDGEVN